MNIKFVGKYKALNDFEWNNIPSLAILTGFNGSGKSQLLRVFADAYGSLSNPNTSKKNGNIFIQKDYSITIENIDFENRGIINWASQGAPFQFENYKFGYKELEKILEVIIGWLHPAVSSSQQKNQEQDPNNPEDYSEGFNRLKWVIETKKDRIISEIITRSGKSKEDIQPEDIMFYLPEDVLSEDNDLINQDNLDMIFFLYLYRKISLEREGLDSVRLGEAPWDLLNKVLNNAGLPYTFTIPSKAPIEALFRNPLNRLSPYQFSAKLIDPTNGIEIGIHNLSSGERIILSLAMLLYYFQFRGVKKSLLLLDEADAHLHPSLTKQFFDVINTVVIQEYGAKVLLATHSPSTVAISPVDRLFVLTKSENRTSVEEVSKDKALSILTTGVPSLSISYENRRQVFVESDNDAKYYDIVFKHIKNSLIQEASLNFISSGVAGRGNCDQVIEIVSKLNGFGNKSIYGIIDWDTKNKSSDNIKVLGEGKRYSIENYIFDPVLMGYYLLRQKIVTNKEVGLPDDFRILDYLRLSKEQLQIVADNFLDKIKIHCKNKGELETSLMDVEYISGIIIQLPKWFLFYKGHDLVPLLFKAFPSLNKYQNENGLRREIIENTIKDIPEFISIELLQLFRSVQTNTV